jgi:rhodanese-related sulfurtransferase
VATRVRQIQKAAREEARLTGNAVLGRGRLWWGSRLISWMQLPPLGVMTFPLRDLFRQALLLVLLALPFGILTALWHPAAPTWGAVPLAPGEVRLATVLQWEETLWLDARSRGEFGQDHIPGALLLNEDEWEELFLEVIMTWSPNQRIVVYCGGSQCEASARVAERLRLDLGAAEIFVLKGGWSEWVQESKEK